MNDTPILVVLKKAVATLLSCTTLIVASASVHLFTRSAAIAVAAVSGTFVLTRPSFAQMTHAEAISLGNTVGRTERSNVKPPASDPISKTLTIKSNNPAVDGTAFNIEKLFQGANTVSSDSLLTSGSSTYGDMTAMAGQSSSQVSGLMDVSNSTPWANGYRTLRNSTVTNPLQKADLRADPALANTQAIATSTDPKNFLGSMDSSCSSSSTDSSTSKTIHISDIRSCDRYTGPATCTATRLVSGVSSTPKLVFHWSGWLPAHSTISVYLTASSSAAMVSSGLTANHMANLDPLLRYAFFDDPTP